MRRETRLGLIAFAVAGFIGLRWWQHRRLDDVERTQATLTEASAAMRALNQADEAFPAAVREGLARVGVEAMVRPAQAGVVLEREVVPQFDAYLITLERAVAGAERVLANSPDPAVARNVELIRARGATTRKMRDALVELRGSIAAGATSDEIAQAMSTIAFSALGDVARQPLPPTPTPTPAP